MSGWQGSHQVSLSSRWRWAATGQNLFSRFDKFTFQDRRDATDACKELDGTRLCGNRVKVEMSNGGKGGRGGRGRSRWIVTVVSQAIRLSYPENKKESINIQYYYFRRSPYRGGRSPPRRRSRSGGRGGRSRSRWTSWQTWSIVTFLSTQEPKEEPQEPVLQECEQGKGQEQVEEPTTQEEEQVTHHQCNSWINWNQRRMRNISTTSCRSPAARDAGSKSRSRSRSRS